MLNRSEAYLLLLLTEYRNHIDVFCSGDEIISRTSDLFDWRIKHAKEKMSDKRANDLEGEKEATISIMKKFFKTKSPSKQATAMMDWAVNKLFRYILDVKTSESITY